MHFPFEHEFGRASQQYVAEIFVAFLETDLELIAALHLDLHWRTESVDARGNQGRSGYTGAASQRLAFNPSFKGAHPNSVRAEQLDEIHVRALRTEVRVPTDLGAELLDHRPVRIGHKEHRMRYSSVQGMNSLLAHGKRHRLRESQILWRRQVHRNPFPLESGLDNAGSSFKSEIAA